MFTGLVPEIAECLIQYPGWSMDNLKIHVFIKLSNSLQVASDQKNPTDSEFTYASTWHD